MAVRVGQREVPAGEAQRPLLVRSAVASPLDQLSTGGGGEAWIVEHLAAADVDREHLAALPVDQLVPRAGRARRHRQVVELVGLVPHHTEADLAGRVRAVAYRRQRRAVDLRRDGAAL